jgi:hypothetical protein
MRVKTVTVGHHRQRKFETPPCLWDYEPPYPDEDTTHPDFRFADWFWAQNPRFPEGRPYDGDLEKVQKTVSLNGKIVQCIVKLANLVLTPENPEYPGGVWHVEGQLPRGTLLPPDVR